MKKIKSILGTILTLNLIVLMLIFLISCGQAEADAKAVRGGIETTEVVTTGENEEDVYKVTEKEFEEANNCLLNSNNFKVEKKDILKDEVEIYERYGNILKTTIKSKDDEYVYYRNLNEEPSTFHFLTTHYNYYSYLNYNHSTKAYEGKNIPSNVFDLTDSSITYDVNVKFKNKKYVKIESIAYSNNVILAHYIIDYTYDCVESFDLV